MVLTELEKEINKLEVEEKLKLVEDIWDSIALNDAYIPIPDWQKIELDSRYKDFQDGKLKLNDWEQIKEELRVARLP